MYTRTALRRIAQLLLQAGLSMPAVAVPLASVHHLELLVADGRERLLIHADVPIEARLFAVDERTLMVTLPGAALAPTAPTLLAPSAQGTVVRVTAFDRARPTVAPEVRIVIQRRPGDPPQLSQSGAVVAIAFDAMARPRATPEPTLSLAGRRVPIKRLVTDVARARGETLIFDDAVSGLGAIAIEGPGRFTPDEAGALLDTILLMKGFVLVAAPAGTRKIVPISGAPTPWSPAAELGGSDAPVTTLLRLETVSAVEIASLITPYLGSHTMAVAFEPTNSLILAGSSARLARLRDVIGAVDAIESGVPVFWALENADAEVSAEQVQEILGPREVPVAFGDPRTNVLLLRVRRESLERARALVDRLDRPRIGTGEFHVVRLRFADPEALAGQLVALRDDSATPGPDESGARHREGLRALDFHVVAEPATRSLVVRTSPEAFGPVHDTIRRLDRMPPSVRLEVTVATITLGDGLDLGFDAFVPTLTSPKAPDDLIAAVSSNPSGGGIPGGTGPGRPFVAAFARAPLLITLIDPSTGQPFVVSLPRESFALSLNGREVETDTLLRPQLLVVSGEEHEVFSGDNVPVRIAQSAVSADAGVEEGVEVGVPFGQVRQDIERHDVGTSLRVTPTVGAEGSVLLDLGVVVSSIGPSQAGAIEVVGPSIREIEVSSTIRLRHGEVAVIASATDPVTVRSESGVPWLQDVPILGFLFRATTEQSMRRYLLIAAQAEILRPETRELARLLAEELGPLPFAER